MWYRECDLDRLGLIQVAQDVSNLPLEVIVAVDVDVPAVGGNGEVGVIYPHLNI